MRNSDSLSINKIPSYGFTIIEMLVSISVFSIILMVLLYIFFDFNLLNFKSKTQNQAQSNAEKIMDVLSYEIKRAKSIYLPTTTASQLSLESTRYLPEGEKTSYIDFFICQTSFCMRKDTQNPVKITSDNVFVENLNFSNILSGINASVKINVTVGQKNPASSAQENYFTTLQQTISLRNNL